MGNEETKLVLELGRRITDDGVRGSQLPEKLALVDERDQKVAVKAAVGNSYAVLVKEKISNKDEGIGNRSLDVQGLENMSHGKARVQDVSCMDDSKIDRIVRPLDDKKNGRLEGNEKCNETGESKRRDELKDRDKKSHYKERDKEKEKKKENAKVKTENQKSKQVRLEDVGRNACLSIASNESTDCLKHVNNDGLNEVNLRKRKDMYTNGFDHETEISANKIQRHAHQSVENGKKLEACRTPTKSYDEHAVPNSVPVNCKVPLMNGIIEVQKSFPSMPHHFSTAAFRDQVAQVPTIPNSKSFRLKETPTVPKMEDLIAEALMRPPHPDSKYLPEVLTIPNVAGLPVNDDDEWLYRKKGALDKPKTDSTGVDNALHIWSKAVYIESAGICAMPFVIPY